MEPESGHRRGAILLGALLIGQLLILTAQVPDPYHGGTYLEGLSLRALSPLAAVVGSVSSGSSGVAEGFRDRGSLRRKVDRLQERLNQLELEHQRRLDAELELELLRQSLGYIPPNPREVLIAEVVYVNHRSWLRSLIVRLPVAAEVPVGSPVTTHAGLVGRVVLVAGRYGRVQLLTDRASSVGAMLERTRRQGIAKGQSVGELSLEYVDRQAEVKLGDRIKTAGIDGVYPRGIPIGTVIDVAEGGELFHRIRVRPSVDLASLDQVFVLIEPMLPPELVEDP